jgi:hypothetical protein
MAIRFVAYLALLAVVTPRSVLAYDGETHRQLSYAAFDRSVLGSYLPSELGIRVGDLLHESVNFYIQPTKDKTAKGWMGQGAVDEDDKVRMTNHFYNPLFPADHRGFHYWAVPIINDIPAPLLNQTGLSSADWGLEDEGDIAHQDFSYKDARGYFFQALTEPLPDMRQNYLAETFYTLGHVIHLLQDLASPQHTRNDPHLGAWIRSEIDSLSGIRETKFYEQYTETKAKQLPPNLPLGSYPVVTLPAARDYWDQAQGKGLAQYSNGSTASFTNVNAGFVTTGTNFIDPPGHPFVLGSTADVNPLPDLPHPDNTGALIMQRDISSVQGYDGPLMGEMDLISTPVSDAYTGSRDTNPMTSTYSIFDADLVREHKESYIVDNGLVYETQATFSVNRLTFDAAQNLLIPRAVGYSAGLLNYFFRGAFAVYGTNYEGAQYAVRNDTTEAMNGIFQLYYDDAQGTRHHFGTDQTIPVPASMPGQPPSTQPFQISFPPDPAVSDCTVVFQGTLGLESGAVAVTYAHLVSGPFVHALGDDTGVSGGAASDLRFDLVSYEWTGGCAGEPDPYWGWFTLCPLPGLSDTSGSLSGGQGAVSAPTYSNIPTMCSPGHCYLTLCVTNSQGNRACDTHGWPI